MRTGLIAAVARTDAGTLRAELRMAGQSVLAWQVDLLRVLGVDRVLCLCESPDREVLRLQHAVEANGAAFHALNGFAAIPALVRAEDDLIILRDGIVPGPAILESLILGDDGLHRTVLCLPEGHSLAAAYPDVFERIDAARQWAGVLAMRGAPAQQLADFPADADAMSVLLRLALQAGTPCEVLPAKSAAPDALLLADDALAVARQERAMIAAAAPKADGRAPMAALATTLVRRIVPRGLDRGAMIAAALALCLALGGVSTAAFGLASVGLGLAGIAAFAARISADFALVSARLRRRAEPERFGSAIDAVNDGLAALTIWFALSPWSQWMPLAICGPLIIGLLRLAARQAAGVWARMAADRSSHLLVLALAAALGILPETSAVIAAIVTAVLLLRKPPV